MKITIEVESQDRANQLIAFDRILTIMNELRENCPWDKKQTIDSLRLLTIEETYELSDAILKNDLKEIKNEIGDVFLHLIFYSKIASEQNHFDITDVLNSLSEKLITRHPHIYGDIKVTNEEDVKRNWEKIKLKETKHSTVLGGVPKSLPAMIKAYRIQEKVKGVGFDWDNKEQVWDKIEEEIKEFKVEEHNNDQMKMLSEFGDILFALINYARFCNINPETALEHTNTKFIKRFGNMELLIKNENKNITALQLNELDQYWELAKKLD